MKRYEPNYSLDDYGCGDMDECEDGAWVRFDDADAELTTTREQLRQAREALAKERDQLDYAWTIICNASGGDWEKESKDWQVAAARFRLGYYGCLDARKLHPPQVEQPSHEAHMDLNHPHFKSVEQPRTAGEPAKEKEL